MAALCVDGGGTKTLALVVQDDGAIVGCGAGGPLAFIWSGGEVVRRSAHEAVRAALAEARLEPAAIQRALVLLGGGNTDEARQAVSAALGGQVPDVVGELVAADAIGEALDLDVLVLAGTGTIASRRLPDGGRAYCNGLGVLLGDEGSGFSLGWEAIRATMRALDGRAPATSLSSAVCRHLLGETGLGSDVGIDGSHRRDLAGRLWLAAVESGRARVAELAPAVSAAAAAGDGVARDILEAAGRELALNAESLLRGWSEARPPRVGGLGGVFRAGPPLTDAFRDGVARSAPGAEARIPEADLVAGAVLLVLEGRPEARRRVLDEWPATRTRIAALPRPPGSAGEPSLRSMLGVIR